MDSVEKAKVDRHRHSKRQLKPLLLHVLEACVALTLLLSLYSTPLSLAIDFAMDGYRKFAGVLAKPFPVFLLSNAIIVVIACLSRNNVKKKKQTTAVSEFSDNIYDEYLSLRQAHPPASSPKPEPPKVEEEKAVVIRADEKKAICYRRTKSALAGGRPRVRPREAALRRSATENGRVTVDDLSNEEFKQTVESYIARTKWFLQKEITADLTETALAEDRTVVVQS